PIRAPCRAPPAVPVSGRSSWVSSLSSEARGGRRGEAGTCRRPLKPPRLARHLARAPPPAPPSPRGGGCARRPAAQGGSRGGDALRFGARYGSSDSLPTARACLPPTADGAFGQVEARAHTVARMLSRTK